MNETSSRADRGFTLIELLLAIVLSGIIGGVTVAALATSLNVASTTTAQVNDSADAGLISSFLVRDAQSAGSIDPTTGVNDATQGVSTQATTAGWSGCAQTATMVVRFSWIDRTVVPKPVVVTYALDSANQFVRRVCTGGTTVDAVLGRHVGSAVASCQPVTSCAGLPTSVSLVVTGTGLRVPLTYTLTAALRTDPQVLPTRANSAPVALVALGTPTTTAACPNLTLAGTGAITVVGSALIDTTCGGAPISGDQTLVRPTGTTSAIPGLVDPFRTRVVPTGTCGSGINPTPVGASTGADVVTVYPQAVAITASVVFAPGRYVFCAGLTMTAGTVTGTNVLLYVAGGTLSIGSGATVDMAGRTGGDDIDLLMWVATAQNVSIAGGAHANTLRGQVYAPTSAVQLSSTLAANIGGVVAKTVTASGTGPMRIGQPMPTLSVTLSSLTPLQVGVASSRTLVSSGGTAPSTWSATGLPAGMTIDATTGIISGTPTTAGTFTTVVTTFDATGAALSVDYSFTVTPRLTISAPATLPAGQATIAYPSTTVTSAGGTSPVRWTATGLPAGLTINANTGVVSGTPTTAGTSGAVVTATDAASATATANYSVTISAAPVVGAVCPTITGWKGEYFSNKTLTTPSSLCRDDAAISFDWGSGAAATGLPTDSFSARWTKTQTFAAGSYTFVMGSDDGSRLFVDGVNVLDEWYDQGYPSPQPTVTITLAAGSHTMVVEYFESGGAASATLTWAPTAPPACSVAATNWFGQYYSNRTLTGAPTSCRDDAAIAFDWGNGSPMSGIPVDNFSVRWTRTSTWSAGTYKFALGTDDGGRLYIDGVLVIDQWVDQALPATPPNVTKTLAAGSHTLVVEYYENAGGAAAFLSTTQVSNGVTATSAVAGDRKYYGENSLAITNSAPITAMTVTISVAQTTGVAYQAAYTNFAGGAMTLGTATSAGTIRYTFDLKASKTVPAGSYVMVGQWSGTGPVRVNTGDTWTITTTSGGIVSTLTGTYS